MVTRFGGNNESGHQGAQPEDTGLHQSDQARWRSQMLHALLAKNAAGPPNRRIGVSRRRSRPNNRPHDSFVKHSGPWVEVTLEFDGHEPGLAAGRFDDSSDVVQGKIVDNSNFVSLLREAFANTTVCCVYQALQLDLYWIQD